MLKSRGVPAAHVAAAPRDAGGAVTPLASIFGSGFLIIVPVLERTLGALSVLGALAVCAVAWLVGTAIRHCVRIVEPLAARDALDATTVRMERAADAVIVVAYVISALSRPDDGAGGTPSCRARHPRRYPRAAAAISR